MNILLLGSGGREHAIAWKIAQSPKVDHLFIAPGNAGTAQTGTNVNIKADDFEAIKSFVLANDVNMVVVGPEDPLVKGVYDFFKNDEALAQIPVIGPSKAGAQLEGSKDFAKAFMQRHGIPTARYKSITAENLEEGYAFLESLAAPYVLKADGLAAGKGVLIVDSLEEAKKEAEKNLRKFFVIRKIADLDIVRDRGVKVPDGVLTTDAMEAIESCQVIVELVGGTTFAKTIILEALKRGKPVVTANKALLAKFGEELFAAAEKSGADIFYEASVGGGIPIIKSLREGLVGNRINRIYGILNGTCNYILTRMERDQADFKEVLADAQKLGYAEANPSLDVDGFDTAHKATIAASLAYGDWFGMDPVYVEGITGITLDEIKLTKELGYKIKLLAIIKQNEGNVEIRVHPTLIPKHSMLAKVDDVFNAVLVNGDFVDDALFYGRGAGRNATASAVVADITDVCLNLTAGSSRRIPGFVAGNLYKKVLPIDNVWSRYYLSLQVADEPGVLAKITNILAAYNISISSVVQKERKGTENVTLVILTHLCEEKNMKAAIVEINALAEVRNNVKFIRIEDL